MTKPTHLSPRHMPVLCYAVCVGRSVQEAEMKVSEP